MDKKKRNKFGILGLNYDTEAGLGWPGARYAPDQIRESLKWILNRIRDNELFDTENNRLIDMSKVEIKDFGNLSKISRYNHEKSMNETKLEVDKVFDQGYVPILLGGDHSVAWPGIKSLYDHTKGNMGLIHLDTHLDLVEDSPIQGKYSGSSEIRRTAELERVKGENIVQVGIRGYNYAEHYHFIKDNNINVINPELFFTKGAKYVAQKSLELASKGVEKIYFTLDIDVLDSAFAPGSGANEPGGISTYQLFKFVKEVAPYVDAIDIVEVNPMTDYRNMTSTVASKIIMDFIVANYYALIE
ncbi:MULTISPECIES: agmatinase family protein [Tissierellales]|jgi:formiminoglutamase/agmatinase|uniref:Arginase family protein n=1 Tax=Acidilutibacter cellobiosedens TaxID=2507161 RepID=A0A410QA48_9FIRM|nr:MULTISPECIES: agmatinase family protein [Tissierellales]QAT60856.1 arginase family protein [Acidilutibacter cellobiosedens]SCL90506.1 Formimidoylglutamase [Sporanaerobacter sp. PP17-6a]